MRLGTLVVINSDTTLVAETVGPETLDGGSILGVREQEPESEDGLGQDVEDGISDDLSVDRPNTSSISNTPDNGVEGPENEGEAANGCKELGGGAVLGLDGNAAWDDELVDDDEVGNAGHGVVSPFGTFSVTKGGEQTEENHEHVGSDGDEDVGSVQAGQESEIEEEEWGGHAPVDVSSPEDLAEDVLKGVRDVLVGLLDDDVCEGDSVTRCHSVV